MIHKKSFHSVCSQVLYLVSWPSLDLNNQENIPHITRICALLARRPSVGTFIPVVLDLSPAIVFPLLEMLYDKGHIFQEISLSIENSIPTEKNTAQDQFLAESESMAYRNFSSIDRKSSNRSSEKTDISFVENLWKRLTESDKLGQPKFVQI